MAQRPRAFSVKLRLRKRPAFFAPGRVTRSCGAVQQHRQLERAFMAYCLGVLLISVLAGLISFKHTDILGKEGKS